MAFSALSYTRTIVRILNTVGGLGPLLFKGTGGGGDARARSFQRVLWTLRPHIPRNGGMKSRLREVKGKLCKPGNKFQPKSWGCGVRREIKSPKGTVLLSVPVFQSWGGALSGEHSQIRNFMHLIK